MEADYYDEIEKIYCNARNASGSAGSRTVLLRANGSDYRTSPVVAIHKQSGNLVHFETLNSNYFLSMDPFPLAAAARSRRFWPRARREVKTIRGNAP